MKATVVLFTGKTLSNGEHPLMLRISDKKKKKYRSLGVSLPVSKWNFKNGTLKGMKARSKQDPKYQEYQDYLNLKNQIRTVESDYSKEITSFAKEGRSITIDQLINKVENPVKDITVLGYFEERIKYWKDKGSIGNAEVYSTAKNRLNAFLKGTDIRFSDIDKPFLKRYREWLDGKNIRQTSISVYLRTIRALFNSAIENGYAKQTDYPFGKNSVISSLSSDTNKRAISRSDVDKIKKLQVKGILKDTQNYFVFGYHGWGINFIDIALLKWNCIENNRIKYIRQKTRKKKQKELSFEITSPLEAVLSYYRPFTGIEPDNYIFPILNKHVHKTPTQIKNRVRKVLTQTNKNLKTIAKMAGIQTKLTTYVWRHTFATVLKNELNTPIEYISEMMGHSDVNVTGTYLAEFDNSAKDKYVEGL